MNTTNRQLKFPCDCISSTTACEEPWALIAKQGMFKDGTKEEILNRLHRKESTIAQLAKSTKMAPPTIFRHLADLLAHKLIKEVDVLEKDHVVERYYKPNFPVITRRDQRMLQEDISELAQEVASVIGRQLENIGDRYAESDAGKAGWTFEEFAQYVVHGVQRSSRKILERKGQLAKNMTKADVDYLFWAKE